MLEYIYLFSLPFIILVNSQSILFHILVEISIIIWLPNQFMTDCLHRRGRHHLDLQLELNIPTDFSSVPNHYIRVYSIFGVLQSVQCIHCLQKSTFLWLTTFLFWSSTFIYWSIQLGCFCYPNTNQYLTQWAKNGVLTSKLCQELTLSYHQP